MKKILSLIILVFALAFNAQDALAQQKPEDIAKIKTATLSETLELTGDQQRALWRALVKKESAYAKQVTGQDLNNAAVRAAKNEIDATLEKDVKAFLTPEQFKQFQASID